MSLRHFHIFFIVTALALCAFLGAWATQGIMDSPTGQDWGLAVCGGVGLLMGIPYLRWFLTHKVDASR